MLSSHVLEMRHVSKKYEHLVLKDLSFSLEEGEIFGLVGRSGAGKTTLMHCVTGLEKPSEGEIWIEGTLLSSLEGAALCQARQKIGMVFQSFNLLSSRTVLENVCYPLEICGRQERNYARELLRIVGLEGKEEAYPATLSGGQKQRVAIARALALKPRILLCDEFTSALDPEITKSILELLLKLNREWKLTIFIITHQMDVIRQICHRVAVLDQGEIVEMGSVAQLFAQPSHPVTKCFLRSVVHEIPDDLYTKGENVQLLRLCFVAQLAKEAIITRMIRHYPVDVNILLGSIDVLQQGTVGHLLVSLTGKASDRAAALHFLKEQGVLVEEAWA